MGPICMARGLADGRHGELPSGSGAAFRAHVEPARLALAVAGDATAITSALSRTISHEITVVPA